MNEKTETIIFQDIKQKSYWLLACKTYCWLWKKTKNKSYLNEALRCRRNLLKENNI